MGYEEIHLRKNKHSTNSPTPLHSSVSAHWLTTLYQCNWGDTPDPTLSSLLLALPRCDSLGAWENLILWEQILDLLPQTKLVPTAAVKFDPL